MHLATTLRTQVVAQQQEVPARLRLPLVHGVDALAARSRTTCPPPPPAKKPPKKPPTQPDKHHGKHDDHGHHGHGHGGGDGKDQ